MIPRTVSRHLILASSLAAADCVAQRFVANVHAKPYPSRVKELFEAAIAACKK